MIRRWTILAAVTAIGGMSMCNPPPLARAADDAGAKARTDARETPRPLAWPAGFTAKSGKPSEGIKSGLVKLAERSVTKGDFKSMLDELSRPDRERAKEWKGADQGKLDVQIEKIRSEWKSKYGKDIDFKDKDTIFDSRFQILEGEVSDPAQALAHWPVACCATNEAVTASGRVPANNSKEVKKEARKEKLEKGRDVALVRFPADAGRPDLTVSMVHHLPAFWRVDIPNDRTGEQIYNDLLHNLTWMAEHSDRWPSNVEDGYRMVAAHAVMAVYGVQWQGNASKG